MRLSTIVCALVLSALISGAKATEVIASCGYSTGYTYFIAGGFVPTDQAGWRREDISSQLLLVRNGSVYDVLNITGSRMTTAASQGAKISVLAQTPDAIILVAVYPGLFERFMFRFSPQREVIWGSTRWNATVKKDSLYRAECKGQ